MPPYRTIPSNEEPFFLVFELIKINLFDVVCGDFLGK